jgi:C1A family cysteine protease
MPLKRKYGLIRDKADDGRDYRFAPSLQVVGQLPAKVDGDAYCPPRVDQGQEGSCTANGTLGAMGFLEILGAKSTYVQRSRQELYFKTRLAEGNQNEDAGGEIRDALRAAAKYGIAPESLWPYIPANLTKAPPPSVIKAGAGYKLGLYERVAQDALHVKAALAMRRPLVIGVTVYSSFEGSTPAATGIIPMPARNEQELGGHCLFVGGYDDEVQRVRGPNSWGLEWGDKGMFELPYDYLLDPNLCSDIWALKAVLIEASAPALALAA